MNFEEAARRVHLNRSIAFFGAGFSHDATNISNKNVASTDELAAILSSAAGESEPLPLSLAAQQYVSAKVAPDIRTFLQNTFSVQTVQPYQEHLACLPWQRIYTTNYDNCLESARRKRGLGVTSPTSLDSPRDYAGMFSIVHLHGFVERLTPDDWDHAFVLTDEQYSSDILRESGWIEAFRNDVSYADAVFFFGYSMSDIDVARLMYENPSIAEKTFLIIGKSPKRSTEVGVSTYGTAITEDVEAVAPMFPNADDPGVPKPAPYLVTLERISDGLADTRPARDNVVDYLIKGDVSPAYVGRDLANGTHDYFVSRDVINSRAETLGTKPERILLHSNLGNGKTSALLEISHYLATAGWSVLWFNGTLDGFEHDVDYLASIGSEGQSKTAIFFENAFSVAPQIKYLLERFPLLSLYITTRTPVLQTRVGDLEDAFGEDFEVIDLNALTDAEIEDLDDILSDNGLWGKRQGQTTPERIKHIKGKLRSDLATVLLDILRSSDIFQRVQTQLRELDKHPVEVKKSVVAALCLSYAGSRLSVSQICEVVRADLFKYGKYQRDPVVLEFMDFDRDRVTTRSSTFARAVLRDVIPDHLLIELVPTLIARLEELRDRVPTYSEAVKQLMRFGYIEQILSDEDKEKKLVAFFEAVRASGVVVSNPQFWLQYAIACMSYGDYKNAESHFASAFGLADKKRASYDPYQIENQYAKFLLESRSKTQDWTDHFDAISQAHEIVSRQMTNFTEGFYPYRVARLYLEFVETNNSVLSRDQLARINGWCEQLLVLAARAPKAIKKSAYWRQATESLKHTRDLISEVS